MSQLDAVASESYPLQTVNKEPESAESKEDTDQTDTEKIISVTSTSENQYLGKGPDRSISSLNISETDLHSTSIQSEEEDKFSDFDPTAVPEEGVENLLEEKDTPPIADASEIQKTHAEGPKDIDKAHTDDSMSDVSSGEDFLSAPHDHSGPEDGEYSDGDEAIISTEHGNKVQSISLESENTINVCKTDVQIKPVETEDCGQACLSGKTESLGELSLPSNQKGYNLQPPGVSSSSKLVENASPINDEDLDSLEDYDHDNDLNIDARKQTTSCVSTAGEIEKQNSDITEVHTASEYDGDNFNQNAVQGVSADTYDSNLNPEPIDSSPDLLTNCGEDTNEDSSKGTEIQLTSAALPDISNVKGMITYIGHLEVLVFCQNKARHNKSNHLY